MARPAVRAVEGNRDHAAYVDSDRGKNTFDPNSVDQPFVARDSLRYDTRVDHFANPARRIDVRNRLRFHRS